MTRIYGKFCSLGQYVALPMVDGAVLTADSMIESLKRLDRLEEIMRAMIAERDKGRAAMAKYGFSSGLETEFARLFVEARLLLGS